MITQCPKCEDTLPVNARGCACGWMVPREPLRMPNYAPAPYTPPSEARKREFSEAAARIGKRRGQWWTLENVTRQSQVDFIVMQSNHFGPVSPAGRFHELCVRRGVIVDGQYVPLAKRVRADREPGDDDEEVAA